MSSFDDRVRRLSAEESRRIINEEVRDIYRLFHDSGADSGSHDDKPENSDCKCEPALRDIQKKLSEMKEEVRRIERNTTPNRDPDEYPDLDNGYGDDWWEPLRKLLDGLKMRLPDGLPDLTDPLSLPEPEGKDLGPAIKTLWKVLDWLKPLVLKGYTSLSDILPLMDAIISIWLHTLDSAEHTLQNGAMKQHLSDIDRAVKQLGDLIKLVPTDVDDLLRPLIDDWGQSLQECCSEMKVLLFDYYSSIISKVPQQTVKLVRSANTETISHLLALYPVDSGLRPIYDRNGILVGNKAYAGIGSIDPFLTSVNDYRKHVNRLKLSRLHYNAVAPSAHYVVGEPYTISTAKGYSAVNGFPYLRNPKTGSAAILTTPQLIGRPVFCSRTGDKKGTIWEFIIPGNEPVPYDDDLPETDKPWYENIGSVQDGDEIDLLDALSLIKQSEDDDSIDDLPLSRDQTHVPGKGRIDPTTTGGSSSIQGSSPAVNSGNITDNVTAVKSGSSTPSNSIGVQPSRPSYLSQSSSYQLSGNSDYSGSKYTFGISSPTLPNSGGGSGISGNTGYPGSKYTFGIGSPSLPNSGGGSGISGDTGLAGSFSWGWQPSGGTSGSSSSTNSTIPYSINR